MFKILKNNKGFFQFLANSAFWKAAAPVVGSVLGGAFSAKSQSDTNKAAAHEADINRQWQEEMSNTAHQREIEDLRAAGLNPILSAKYGGASTPTGGMASFQNPGHDLATSLSSGISSAIQAQQARASVALTNAQKEKTIAETKYIKAGMGDTTKQPWFVREAKNIGSTIFDIKDANDKRRELDRQNAYNERELFRKKRRVTVKSW